MTSPCQNSATAPLAAAKRTATPLFNCYSQLFILYLLKILLIFIININHLNKLLVLEIFVILSCLLILALIYFRFNQVDLDLFFKNNEKNNN